MVNKVTIIGFVARWPGRWSSVLAPAPAASHTCAQERQHQQDHQRSLLCFGWNVRLAFHSSTEWVDDTGKELLLTCLVPLFLVLLCFLLTSKRYGSNELKDKKIMIIQHAPLKG
jgi:hypothetical protein